MWEARKPDGKWAYSTKMMGDSLGVSKNAICSLRRRMKLDTRGSPLTPGWALENGVKVPRIAKPRVRKNARQMAIPNENIQFSQDLWLVWFNRLTIDQKRRVSEAEHPVGCRLIAGGGMWRCSCGLALPGSPLVRLKALNAALPAPEPKLEASVAEPPIDKPAPSPKPRPTCCWPTGTPPHLSFCDGEAKLGKSYCEEHCKAAYTTYKRPDEPQRRPYIPRFKFEMIEAL
jgi:hypothetical protein